MKITSWNVNSIRRRIDAVLAWLDRNEPDILCLQETKCVDEAFPWIGFRAAGYDICVVGQKGYNGVAIASRLPQTEVLRNPVGPTEGPARSIMATIGGYRILNVYVPHGDEVGSQGFHSKLEWFTRLDRLLRSCVPDRPEIVSGDFNVAPDDRDVFDPGRRRERLICSSPERAAFGQLLEAGYVDAFRERTQEPGHYTWWSHRIGAVHRNRGLRVDHHLVAASLRHRIQDLRIDRPEREREGASDHAPITLEIG